MKFYDYFKDLVKKVIGGMPLQSNDVSDALQKLDERLGRVTYSNFFEILSINANKLSANGRSNASDILFEIIGTKDNYEDYIYDLFARRKKYKAYKDVMKKISRLSRAIKVIRSNIISSDNIRNRNLIYTSSDSAEQEKEIVLAKEIFSTLNIDNYKSLSKIIDNTLTYGDYFIEIVLKQDLESYLFKEERLTESSENFVVKNKMDYNFEVEIETSKKENKRINCLITLEKNVQEDRSILLEETQKNIVLDDVFLIFHKPHNVIKMHLNNNVYGYLIVPESLIKTSAFNLSTNVFYNREELERFAKSFNIDYVFAQNAIKRSANITKNVLDFLKNSINSKLIEENDALKTSLAKLILMNILVSGIDETQRDFFTNFKNINVLNIPLRFVSVDRMQEFCINSDEYEPYGTGIFDNILFDAGLLVSDKITSTIERLTKSIERRIINFEIDNRNSIALIETIKEKFRKKKALFGNRESFDTIPSLITPFEDYYIPQKDGVPYITFNTEPPTSQHQSQVDDMKFKRDEIVSDLNIPPAYLGLEENIESRATLYLQSILFAIDIMDYQETFATDFTSLLNKIKRLLGLNVGNINVSFPSPIILSTSSEIEHINNVSGIKDFLIEMGIDKSLIKNRYLSFLDEFFSKETKTKIKLEKLENHEKEGEDEEGMKF